MGATSTFIIFPRCNYSRFEFISVTKTYRMRDEFRNKYGVNILSNISFEKISF